MRFSLLNIVILIFFFACTQEIVKTPSVKEDPVPEMPIIVDPIKGMSFVAPPDPFPKNPIPPLTDIGVNWISIIPYGFTPQGQTKVHYNNSQWQWWGEKPEGVIETNRLAKVHGIKTMLKPQIYVPGDWPGGIKFESEEKWREWEDDYTKFIMDFVTIAINQKIDMICIGTEFKVSTMERNDYWVKLIENIRKIYAGKLTYAANWDEYQHIQFWGDLDYIGVDAYFPLVNEDTPSISALQAAWKDDKAKMKKISEQFDVPILFTEYGYLSVDGCAYNNWELEKNIDNLSINELAQANAIDAVLSTFWMESFWAGGFLWKWFPNLKGHEGYLEKDYTPQGKKSLETLKEWFL